MSSNTIVFYHSPCWDGFTSAWVARKVLPDAEFIPVDHDGTDKVIPEQVRDKDVFVLDFAFEDAELKLLLGLARSVKIIDHHKSREQSVRSVPGAIFDLTKSGARLTWEYFFPGRIVPPLVLYVEDRDLWAWKLSNSKEICAAFSSYPLEFDTLDILNSQAEFAVARLIEEGAAILRANDMEIRYICRHAFRGTLDGHECMIVNSSTFQSEIGHYLLEIAPETASLAVIWNQRIDGQFYYSLRSREDGPDISVLATKLGGGGHPRAGAFSSDKLLTFK